MGQPRVVVFLDCFSHRVLTDTAEHSASSASPQAANIEGMLEELRTALWARCDAFETAVTERLDSERLEKIETSMAGLILSGEHTIPV